MNIYRLRLFCAVVENQSFTKAAADFWLTQPTISTHIKELEKYFKLQLLERSHRSIEPTEAGLLVYRAAKKILQEADTLEKDLNSIIKRLKASRGEAPKVVIGASSTPANYLLPPAISLFREKYPKTKISIVDDQSNHILELLLEGEVDLGFIPWEDTRSKEVSENLTVDFIFEEPLVLVTAKKVQETVPALLYLPLKQKDLNHLPLVLPPASSSLGRSILSQLKNLNLNVPVAMEAGPVEALKKVLKTFLGASILNISSVQEEVTRGEFYLVPIEGLNLRMYFALVHQKRQNLSPAVKDFALFLKRFLLRTD